MPSRNIDNLRACVDAVRDHEPKARIIAVDDGIDISMWAEWAAFGKSPADIVRIGEKPFNFARNVNIGIRAADEDDVILLNDDALLESPGGFTLMQRAAEDHPEYGIIGAVTNVTGQPLQRPRGLTAPCRIARGRATLCLQSLSAMVVPMGRSSSRGSAHRLRVRADPAANAPTS